MYDAMSVTGRDPFVMLLTVLLIAASIVCAFHSTDDPADDVCLSVATLALTVLLGIVLVLQGRLQPLAVARLTLHVPGLPGPPPKA